MISNSAELRTSQKPEENSSEKPDEKKPYQYAMFPDKDVLMKKEEGFLNYDELCKLVKEKCRSGISKFWKYFSSSRKDYTSQNLEPASTDGSSGDNLVNQEPFVSERKGDSDQMKSDMHQIFSKPILYGNTPGFKFVYDALFNGKLSSLVWNSYNTKKTIDECTEKSKEI